jgi:hypothetical protein
MYDEAIVYEYIMASIAIFSRRLSLQNIVDGWAFSLHCKLLWKSNGGKIKYHALISVAKRHRA